jgi:dTDP-4-dehydrorhamnose 3,5-epimerase
VIFTATKLPGAFTIEPERRSDERGYLARTFSDEAFATQGLETRFLESSTIFSPRSGTLRGLHFQEEPHAEVKLIRCTRGAAHVVFVDLRPDSTTRASWDGVTLSSQNGLQLYVPKGFAQGYQTLVDETEMHYQMSSTYHPEAANGIRWDDPAFGIEWPPAGDRIISERDTLWSQYREA